MRAVPAAMTTAWKASLKTGASRPVVRATVQQGNLRKFEYDTTVSGGVDFDHQRHRKGFFTSLIFGDQSPVKEIRNIKNFSWTRSVDQDVATATMVILNTDITPIGNADETAHAADFDLPGFFTYNRGQGTVSANPWGYDTETGWQDMFVPDNIIRTFEGYGCDLTVAPALDANLLQSGMWLIDKVTYTDDGQITVEMRDVGRLLLDQIVFPPVIPYSEYPLSWDRIKSETVTGIRDATGGSFTQLKGLGTASSSNDYYIGLGIQDPPHDSYVGPNGGVQGHRDGHAMENVRYDPGEQPAGWQGHYWLSTGQTTPMSKVWWQVDLDSPTALAALRIHPKGGPYRVFISLHNGTKWLGNKKIAYNVTTENVDIEADIPFVKSVAAERALPFDVILNRKYGNITKIRLTFTNLWDTKVGNYPFRAGLHDLMIYTAADVASLGFTEDGTALQVTGNYRDYTDIVKWCCAWGGFYWPPAATNMDFIKLDKDNTQTISYASADAVLPKGNIWGDFMKVGTAGVSPLTTELFDKQPLMDVINYVRDTVGYVFFIDETGGVVWRMPNLWELGNYLSPAQLAQRTKSRTTDIVTIDEEETLLSYSTTLDSRNIRERVFVGNTTGHVGTVIKGFTPHQNRGMRRIAGWTDQHFETKNETRIMADLIAARHMFDYRRGKVTTPGYPAIQIDDQIRIFERVTNETYYHYVLSITSNIDMEAGEWTYDMDTHWLGERPSDAWVVRVDQLDQVTQAYLAANGGA